MKKLISVMVVLLLLFGFSSQVGAADPHHPTVVILSPSNSSTTTNSSPTITLGYSTPGYTIFTYAIDSYVASCVNPLSRYGTDTENPANFRLPYLSLGVHTITVCANSFINGGVNYSPKRSVTFTVIPTTVSNKIFTN